MRIFHPEKKMPPVKKEIPRPLRLHVYRVDKNREAAAARVFVHRV